jgi:hypothetical protein
MDLETRALLIGLYKTLSELTESLVEEGAIDSTRVVRSFRDFVKSLGDEPHDQATRLWVDRLVETLEANPSSARHLPASFKPPGLPAGKIAPRHAMYAPASREVAAATVTFSSTLAARFPNQDHAEAPDDGNGPAAPGGHAL